MTDISAASITHRKDEKNYITNYWQNAVQTLPICAKQSCTVKNSFYGSRRLTATCRRTAA